MSLKRTLAKALIGVALVSSLYGLPTKKANAWELVLPSGWTIIKPTINKPTFTNKSKKNIIIGLDQTKMIKHNMYKLIYPRNNKNEEPDGFRIYIDENGDNKSDYTLTY